jgi:uncharacterized protein
MSLAPLGYATSAHLRIHARLKRDLEATGKDIDVRVAHHFTVRGGLIVRFEQFTDTAKVRDAMA